METSDTFCVYLTRGQCNILEERCLKLRSDDKWCDFLHYYGKLKEISNDVPNISSGARSNMLEPFLSNWKTHAQNPLPGRKDMTARPLEKEFRDILKSALNPLGVVVPETGQAFKIWGNTKIIADALATKERFPTCIFSAKTWLGEGQIRETFGYAYLSKMWLGQRNIRVYMVGLQEISEHLRPLIELFKPYVDGVYSLCGTPYVDDLIKEVKRLYSE